MELLIRHYLLLNCTILRSDKTAVPINRIKPEESSCLSRGNLFYYVCQIDLEIFYKSQSLDSRLPPLIAKIKQSFLKKFYNLPKSQIKETNFNLV